MMFHYNKFAQKLSTCIKFTIQNNTDAEMEKYLKLVDLLFIFAALWFVQGFGAFG